MIILALEREGERGGPDGVWRGSGGGPEGIDDEACESKDNDDNSSAGAPPAGKIEGRVEFFSCRVA
eukprot:756116-Prorocentrum_minimum.AAC.1